MNKDAFFNRVLKYAHKTGIGFVMTQRSHHWKSFGLPDTRGFTPHLREVRLYKSQTEADSWVIHDLLHIVFYDFATLELGKEAWADHNRLREIHLASEAFAVLSLDYHILSFEEGQGLAVDCDFSRWPNLKKLNPKLPDFLSESFCQALVDLYLSDDESIFLLDPKQKIKKSQMKDVAYYKNWVGHEIRYAKKQRLYVEMWLSDLLQKPKRPVASLIEESGVAAALWEALQLLVYSSDREFNRYIQRIKSMNPGPQNYFKSYPKYKSLVGAPRGPIDFRFTDLSAVSGAKIKRQLEAATKPRPENLFLLWQILSQTPPKHLSPKELKSVSKLAQSSQTQKVDLTAWKEVREICLKSFTSQTRTLNPRLKSCFFLP